MTSLLKSILAALGAFLLTDWLLPTVIISGWLWLFLAAVLFLILYTLVRPILKLLLLPFNIITFGLVNLLLNAGLLWLLTLVIPGIQIKAMILFGLPLPFLVSLGFTASFISLIHNLFRRLLR